MSSVFKGVLTKQAVETFTEGEIVVLKIGNSEIRFHYADAFKLSQAIRLAGKQAKATAGDTARHWSVLGVLDDANASQ